MILNNYNYLTSFIEIMTERDVILKDIILAILAKCKDALPELTILSKHVENLNRPISKHDCLNPLFLMQLSDCGQQIKNVFQKALLIDFPGRQCIRQLTARYMDIIKQIRKYHKQAHLIHDIHANSTQMKERLLIQLKKTVAKNEELERKLIDKKQQILQLQEKINEICSRFNLRESDLNMTIFSRISPIQTNGSVMRSDGKMSRFSDCQNKDKLKSIESQYNNKLQNYKNDYEQKINKLKKQSQKQINKEKLQKQQIKKQCDILKAIAQQLQENMTPNEDDYLRFVLTQSISLQGIIKQNDFFQN